MSVQPFGFAIRHNGTCGDDLEECGEKATPFHACCPRGSWCNEKDYNTDCCPEENDCTVELYRDPVCANDSWDLYEDPAEGYSFCCEEGLTGFVTKNSESFGCADPKYELLSNETALTPQQDPTATKTPTAAPTASDAPGPEQGTPDGVIAGGVVGGVVGVALIAAAAIWWFRIRTGGEAEVPPRAQLGEAMQEAISGESRNAIQEAPQGAVYEAPNDKSKFHARELDGTSQSRPVELPN